MSRPLPVISAFASEFVLEVSEHSPGGRESGVRALPRVLLALWALAPPCGWALKSRSLTPSHLQSLLPRPLPIRWQGPCWTFGTRRCEAAAGPAHARCRERLLNAAAALSPTCRTEGLSRFWRECEHSRLKWLREASPQSRRCLLFTAVLFHSRSPQEPTFSQHWILLFFFN